ncbi:sigma-70 family RNA polymerase sigma factor [Candidatus Woesearchaeota archaeon]|nr:sigma-70 family RNA polymerase sigma factor [Candidatus Woesearchaeota archaeon]
MQKTRIRDSFEQYLKEINQYPLLSAEEEFELATTYLRIRNPDSKRYAARQTLINCNLRLVVRIAKLAYRKYPMPEKVSAGNLGLIKAVDTFDPFVGRLANYASYWILQRIQSEYVQKRPLVHIPVSVQDQRKIIHAFQNRIYSERGYYPSAEELFRFVKERFKRSDTSAAKLLEHIAQSEPVIEKGRSGRDMSDDDAWPVEALEHEDLCAIVRQDLLDLTDREWHIIHNSFFRKRNYTSIGEDLGLSRGRIQQIRAAVLTRMKKRILKGIAVSVD